ncbi:proline racemase family protein [Xanthobacter sp. 126]|uniref:proline racemase family protein n=1 Tax=Xanthobacter sp. 126 TaxID=1131814 RepID=UPI0004AF4792|nr:proline racemase family protein [Xanthobacter sp. 126]
MPFDLPGIGSLKADIVWGGNYFGIIDLRGTSLRISPENGSQLSQLGVIAREQLRQKVGTRHPASSHIDNFNFVTFWHEPTIEGAFYKNVHVFSAGQLDRSPGGTGTSAMMAMFEARGELKMHQPIRSEGLIGSGTFEGCLIGEANLNGTRAVRPTVKGTAGCWAQRAGRSTARILWMPASSSHETAHVGRNAPCGPRRCDDIRRRPAAGR